MAEVATLVPTKADADVAAELKERMSEKLLEVCKIIDEGKRAGFVFTFGLGTDYAGKAVIAQLIAAKHY